MRWWEALEGRDLKGSSSKWRKEKMSKGVVGCRPPVFWGFNYEWVKEECTYPEVAQEVQTASVAEGARPQGRT